MKRLFVLAALVLFSIGAASAQNYDWALGLRGGYTSGVTLKRNFGYNAVEAIGSFHPNTHGEDCGQSFSATALFEWQIPVITEGFAFYYGLGGFVRLGNYLGGGASAVAGLEYRIPRVPLVVSIDCRPCIGVWRNFSLGSNYFDFGLGIKYTF